MLAFIKGECVDVYTTHQQKNHYKIKWAKDK